MKQRVFQIVLVLLLIPFIIGCKKDYAVGTDAAKLLLANERLNGDVIRNSGNLFTTGQEAMNNIVKQTKKYRKQLSGRPNETYTEVDGNTYKWYNDVEYSNFGSFFESYAVNIEDSAKRGSELIDYVKEEIRVVDVWVKDGGDEYLLKVDKISETIFSRNNEYNQVEMCKRYTNESGNDVYEMYIQNDNATTRMKYIPGLLYEFGIESDGYTHYLIADNSKGYWNVVSTTGVHEIVLDDVTVYEDFTINAMMMKEEAFYKFFHSLNSDEQMTSDINSVSIISNDGKTDLVTIGNGYIELYNTGINGLDHIEIEATPEFVGDYNSEDPSVKYVYKQENVDNKNKKYYIYSTSGAKSATAVLENGMILTKGDTLIDGEVEVGRIDVGYVAGCDSYGTIPFTFASSDLNETLDTLKMILNETGIIFRRDLDEVIAGAEFAVNDVKNFGDYFQLNGYNINSIENAKLAMEIESSEISEFEAIYSLVKDLNVINRRNQLELDENINFANLVITNNGKVENTQNHINVEGLSVKVEDTILFVDGEEYKVVLALETSNNSLIPLSSANELKETFVVGNSFEMAQTLSVDIPVLDAGSYSLVIYIANAEEGIRVTNPVHLTGEFENYFINNDGLRQDILVTENSNLVINVYNEYDIYLQTTSSFTYDELVAFMAQSSYNHGMINETIIEKFDGANWNVIKSGSLIDNGQYRMNYIVTIEESVSQGYVIVTIS